MTGSATSFNTSSDYRLKESVADIAPETSRARLAAVRPRSFVWKASGAPSAGFIAHEFAEAYPAAVVGERDGEAMQMLSPAGPEVIADIINDVNALHSLMAVVRAQLEAVSSDIASLRASRP